MVDLVMPKMGESIMEATILRWHKKQGDQVKEDETVLEIATDKVDSEVPASTGGEIAEILFHENEVVAVGTVIARIKTTATEPSWEAPAPVPAAAPEHRESPKKMEPAVQQTSGANAGFYSPLVLTIARNEGISLTELENIQGTGNDGRVTKKDILQFVAARKTDTVPDRATVVEEEQLGSRQVSTISSASVYSGHVEILEMDRMRKLIAEHMVRSKATSAHVTSFSEADVTNLVRWKERIKKDFEKRESEKLTYTPLFIEALIKSIKKFPLINSSVDGSKIIIKKDIHIGMATALQGGNLIVPVIRNADQLNLVGLTKQVNALAGAARNGKLKPDDTLGGTFTLSNVGSFGSLMGTPIINQPQVAILAVGIIKKRPVVVETQQGDSIAIRHMMYLSLSYDHRIIDGSLGSTFLSSVANELEHFNPEREF